MYKFLHWLASDDAFYNKDILRYLNNLMQDNTPK